MWRHEYFELFQSCADESSHVLRLNRPSSPLLEKSNWLVEKIRGKMIEMDETNRNQTIWKAKCIKVIVDVSTSF